MKKDLALVSFLIALLLPSLIFKFFSKEEGYEVPEEIQMPAVQEETLMIKVKDREQVTKIELEEYVAGVLRGEMPSDFDLEALKAQAVATRTYTLRRILKGSKHKNADVCTDATCCQAYQISSKHRDINGKIEQAVMDTKGQVLTYDGELIEATYFSCSGGRTEDAVAVWGSDIPYLKSVLSPGEEISDKFESIFHFTSEQLYSKLGLQNQGPLSQSNIQVTYTSGGGVKQMYLNGIVFTGLELRTLLNLPSTAFQVIVEDDRVQFTVKGNGHRVGLSQYGAEAMAVSGMTYEQILSHYYPGTKLEAYTYDKIHTMFDKAGNL